MMKVNVHTFRYNRIQTLPPVERGYIIIKLSIFPRSLSILKKKNLNSIWKFKLIYTKRSVPSSKRLQLIYHSTRTHRNKLKTVAKGPRCPNSPSRLPLCVHLVSCTSIQPSNKLPSNAAAQSKHRDIAFIGCSPKLHHTWPASTWVEEGGGGKGIVEAAKIGSSHLQIEFDSIGGGLAAPTRRMCTRPIPPGKGGCSR